MARTSALIRAARPADLERLLPQVRDFWLFEKLRWETVDVSRVLASLLDDPSRGRVFVAEADGELVGYSVLAFGYSLEHGGLDALVDELYVRPELRGDGLGTRLLEALAATCRALGITRLHLEVDRTNPRAQKLYARLGFGSNDRFLLTKKLDT